MASASPEKTRWMRGPSTPLRGALLGLLLERPGHGGDLANRLAARLGETWRVDTNDVYRLLEQLEKTGLAISRDEPKRGNARRTHLVYHPTPGDLRGADPVDGDSAAPRAGAAGPAGEAVRRTRAGRARGCSWRCGPTSASASSWRRSSAPPTAPLARGPRCAWTAHATPSTPSCRPRSTGRRGRAVGSTSSWRPTTHGTQSEYSKVKWWTFHLPRLRQLRIIKRLPGG